MIRDKLKKIGAILKKINEKTDKPIKKAGNISMKTFSLLFMIVSIYSLSAVDLEAIDQNLQLFIFCLAGIFLGLNMFVWELVEEVKK